jgi:alpha-tubulin suppressor-like RCC1 family protein
MGTKRGGIVGLCTVVMLVLSCAVAASAWGVESRGFAWGGGGFKGLGDGELSESAEPFPITGLSEVAQIAGGENFGLALSAEGTVVAWGVGLHGQLGDGSDERSNLPVPVSGLSEVTAIAASGTHSLALLADGAVEAWGDNTEGDLGDGGSEASDVPVLVTGLSGVTAIAAGADHSLALLSNGTVEAWGDNINGELGDGTTEERKVPVPVSGLSEVVAIAAGADFSLALLSDGEVRSWGGDRKGELGDAGHCACTQSMLPIAADLSEVAAIAAGDNHALALLDGGTVEAWGEDKFGDLGDGDVTNTSTPGSVSGLSEVKAVAAGGFHSLALLDNGSIVSWGGDENGVLGNDQSGADLEFRHPVTVACHLEGIVGIDSGFSTAFAWGGSGETCPAIFSLSTHIGSPSAETPVTITGTGFTEVSSVTFAGLGAASFTVESSTVIHAMAPPGTGAGSVVVTTPKGVNQATDARFSYESPPEFGKCKSIGAHTGGFDTGCKLSETETGEPNNNTFEWYPAFGTSNPVVKRHFALSSSGALTFETADKAKISCGASAGTGEYTGDKTVAIDTLTLTSCSETKVGSCQSGGAKAGEVEVSPIAAQLGRYRNKTTAARAGIELSPASGEVLAEFSCAGIAVAIKGSVILEVGIDKMAAANKWKASQSKQVQQPTAFEGSPEATLSAKVGAGAGYEGAVLKAKLTQTSEESIEIDDSVAIL